MNSKGSEVIRCVFREWNGWGESVHRDLDLPWNPGLWFWGLGWWRGRETLAPEATHSPHFLAYLSHASRGHITYPQEQLFVLCKSLFPHWRSIALQHKGFAKLEHFYSVKDGSKNSLTFQEFTVLRGTGFKRSTTLENNARWGFTVPSVLLSLQDRDKCNV